MIKYVFSLTRKEFMLLNNYDTQEVLLHRNGSTLAKIKDELPIKCYIVVKNGKENTIIFERQVAQQNIDELDLERNINEQLTYAIVEQVKANGYIIASAEITRIDTENSAIYLKGLNILDSMYSLEKVGVKRVPSVFSKITKELEDENNI